MPRASSRSSSASVSWRRKSCSRSRGEALTRPLFAFAFVIYAWKVVVFDKVLGLGTTDPLSGDIAQWAMITLGGRSLEKVARILGRK
jgi:hypothetical protein